MDIANIDLFPGTILCKTAIAPEGQQISAAFMEDLALVAVQAVVYGVLAYILYRNRKAEAAGEVHGLYQKQKCG